MKFRSPLVPPRRDNGALLPALLAGLLAAACVQQLVAPIDPDLPASGAAPATQVARYAAPGVRLVSIPDVIEARPLFAPSRAGTGTGDTADVVLDGAVVAGSVNYRGRVRAVVRTSNGTIEYVPIGRTIAGWQLVGLGADAARFARAGEKIDVPYGAASVVQPAEAEDEEEEANE